MQSEDFDKRIRDAAENHHPQYNEQAWNGMEKLLNRHMPVEKDRRRFIFFILLAVLLLGGGVTWLLTTQPWKRTTDKGATEKTIAGNKSNTNTDQSNNTSSSNTTPDSSGSGMGNTDRNGQPLNNQTGEGSGTNTNVNTTTDPIAVQPGITTGNTDPGQPGVTKPARTNSPRTPGLTRDDQVSVAQGGGAIGKRNRKPSTNTGEGIKNANDKSDPPAGKEIAVNNSDPVKELPPVKVNDPVTPDTTTIQPPADVAKVDSPDTKTDSAKKEPGISASELEQLVKSKPVKPMRPDKKPLNSLSLTISGGGDISSVKLKNSGKMQSVFGAGLSYSFHDKLIVRSGVYTGHKIYTANPTDYKVAPNVNTTNLKRIEADCNVLEIPLGVAYNFGKAGGKQNIFAATSLSTFLMKEENYDYVYQFGGTTYSYDWDYKNQNKHFFSVLTLSAGYTRKFGKRFSLSAEPYIKFPLTGIGQGQVKLNNMGVLFTFGTKLTGVR
jgi:hypothetical protein